MCVCVCACTCMYVCMYGCVNINNESELRALNMNEDYTGKFEEQKEKGKMMNLYYTV